MEHFGPFLIALGFAGHALVSKRIEATILSMPMAMAGFGWFMTAIHESSLESAQAIGLIRIISEVTLVLVLFSDASRARLNVLRRDGSIPARMLLVGLPLTLLLGTLLSWWIIPDTPLASLLLLAAILTPTDAALGQSVLASPLVPERLCEAINAESGLNDGLAAPAVFIAAILASGSAGDAGSLMLYAGMQVVFGPIVGFAVGWCGAKLMDASAERNWFSVSATAVFVISTAFAAYFGAEIVGGNGFIATFVAGLTFGAFLRHERVFTGEIMENEGRILTMATFFVFGATLLPEGLARADGTMLILAMAFLTVVRMVPVAISLRGLGLGNRDIVFLGWFGPRGLASILFALLIAEEYPSVMTEQIASCIVLTVALSIVLHGITANPMARAFPRRGSGDGGT
ncbi:MAG: cation:proton antiporter [Geminicoccaceae bacterium]|nr:cation:proton antiporter [Geminicoccaceae bacterium]